MCSKKLSFADVVKRDKEAEEYFNKMEKEIDRKISVEKKRLEAQQKKEVERQKKLKQSQEVYQIFDRSLDKSLWKNDHISVFSPEEKVREKNRSRVYQCVHKFGSWK